MSYLIIAIIAIVVIYIAFRIVIHIVGMILGALLLLIMYILFHPCVNSVISIIAFAFIASYAIHQGGPADPIILLYSIATIDCIRDIVRAKELYYYDIANLKVDRDYTIKSILSILTFGFARAIFILIIVPVICFIASINVKRKMKSGYPFIDFSADCSNRIYSYYYQKKLEKYYKKGKLISNEAVIDAENQVSRTRLDKLYPEKTIGKIIEAIAGDNDMKKRRVEAEKKLFFSSKSSVAYVSTKAFNQYPQALINAMSQRSTFSPTDIKDFKELKYLHFDEEINYSTEWAVYFIILALQPLVESGEFTDDILNDNDVFDNHAYQYLNSKVQLSSIDADNDPRFALD